MKGSAGEVPQSVEKLKGFSIDSDLLYPYNFLNNNAHLLAHKQHCFRKIEFILSEQFVYRTGEIEKYPDVVLT